MIPPLRIRSNFSARRQSYQIPPDFQKNRIRVPRFPFNLPKPVDILWLLSWWSQCLKCTTPKSRYKSANKCRIFRRFESVNLKRRSVSLQFYLEIPAWDAWYGFAIVHFSALISFNIQGRNRKFLVNVYITSQPPNYFGERHRLFWSGECAGSAIPPVNLNNAHFDTQNGVKGPKTRIFTNRILWF